MEIIPKVIMEVENPYSFNPIIPQPFTLKRHSEEDRNKLRDDGLEKVSNWQTDMNPFFGMYQEYAQDWRIRPRNEAQRKSRGISNEKSGETHRATETLATLFFRMLTASDSFFQGTAMGLDVMGNKVTEQDIYASEQVMITQMRRLKFKPELLRSLTSMSLFGSVIYELYWKRLLNPDGINWFEGTQMRMRSLLTTAFDTSMYDIEESDYMIPIDYWTKWRIRQAVTSEPENWDKEIVEESISENKNKGFKTDVYNQVLKRRTIAGYHSLDDEKNEVVSYYGRCEDNPIIDDYWTSKGFEGDPKDYDFCFKIINGQYMPYFSHAPYGSWHTKFKSAHFKQFELEPLAYGVGQLGNRTQRSLDNSFSRASDLIRQATWGIYKLGRYAGLSPNQMTLKPHQTLLMDDVEQLKKLEVDLNGVTMSLNLQNIYREEIRANTSATTNLQAQSSGGTATESALVQNEAMRSVSVHAEIIGETLIREILEQSHINNLNFLDSPIWVSISGEEKPRLINKDNLPMNIGWEIKITTDKDYRPQRSQNILEGIKTFVSLRNDFPPSINPVPSLTQEYYRSIGLNPRLLGQVRTVADEMQYQLQQQMKMRGSQNVGQNLEAEIAGATGQNPQGTMPTPVGDVQTSPNTQSINDMTSI